MSRYSEATVKEHTERIRALMVQNPTLSILQITKQLTYETARPLNLTWEYVAKLHDKIRRERAHVINRASVEGVLGDFRDEVERLKVELWKIIFDEGEFDDDGKCIRKPPSAGEKAYCIAEIRKSSDNLIDRMFDAGIFDRNLGAIKVERKMSKEDEAAIQTIFNSIYARPETIREDSGELALPQKASA